MKGPSRPERTHAIFQPFVLIVSLSVVLSACEFLPTPRQGTPLQTPSSSKTPSIEPAREKALSLLSALALRVGADRYQAELFGDALPGSPEDLRRVRWIETQFQKAGLLPAGDLPHSWRHPMALTGYQSQGVLTALTKGGSKNQGVDEGVVVWSMTPIKELRLERSEGLLLAPHVTLHRDIAEDQKEHPGVFPDLRGKMVFMKEERTRTAAQQFAWGAHQGVAGLILIHDPQKSDLNWNDIVKYAHQEHFIVASANGNSDTPPVMGWITVAQAQQWLGVSRSDPEVEAHRFIPIPIPLRLTLHTTWKAYEATEVVGTIKGDAADSALTSVVFRSCPHEPGITSLIAAAQGLSKPGETPHRDIIFKATSVGQDCNPVWNAGPLGGGAFSQQHDLNFDAPVSLKGAQQDNDHVWQMRSQTSQQILNQGYLLAGPWTHH